jgi:thymidylate synthase ThyX
LAMSAARCARVSYLTHNKENPLLEEDDTLYRRLVESKPLHASPLEHQACVLNVDMSSKNLRGGWMQHRTMLEAAGSIEDFHTYLVSEK